MEGWPRSATPYNVTGGSKAIDQVSMANQKVSHTLHCDHCRTASSLEFVLTLTAVSPWIITSKRRPAGTFASLPFLKPQNGAAGQKSIPVTTTAVATVPPLLSPFVLFAN